jgi:hypothetical protein
VSRSILTVKYSSTHDGGGILLVGPKSREYEARLELEEKLYEILRECRYLDYSQRAQYWAERIAEETPYRQARRGSPRADEIRVYVSLDVLYRNHPGPWKWWARIRTDRNGTIDNTVSPGMLG